MAKDKCPRCQSTVPPYKINPNNGDKHCFYCMTFIEKGGEMSEKKKKFLSGKWAIFNPVPRNEEKALQHGNALAAGRDSNYPVGTSECFNVGISGGCGIDCFVYQKGECSEPGEMLERITTKEELEIHYDLYPLELRATKCE